MRFRQSLSSEAAGLRLSVLLFAAAFAAQIGLYQESFQVRPAGDDFAPPLAEIARGEREGPLALFVTRQSAYRPFQSITMWLFGRISEEHRFIWLSVMRFVAMALYGFVCWLWTRLIGLTPIGTLVTAIAFFVHPAFGGILGGIDTFAGPVAHAFMWLGALAVIVFRDRFTLAVTAALICLIIGSLYKEYGFGLVPLAPLTTFVFSPRRPLVRTIIMAVVLLAFMLISLYSRRYLGVEVEPRLPSQSLDQLVTMGKNAGLLAAATLFTGDTIWVNLQRSPLAMAWVIFNVASLIGLVGVGIGLLVREVAGTETADTQASSSPPQEISAHRWVVYLILSLAAASFPANMIPYRVSEIYVSGMILPLALLCGLAAEGFSRGPRWIRWAAIILAAGHVAVSCAAVTSKVHSLRTAGEMSTQLLDQIASLLPEDARDLTVALVFVSPEVASVPNYSVFVMGADTALQSAEFALEYRLPGRGLVGELVYVDSPDEIDLDAHPLILRWDQQAGQFLRVK